MSTDDKLCHRTMAQRLGLDIVKKSGPCGDRYDVTRDGKTIASSRWDPAFDVFSYLLGHSHAQEKKA